LELSFIYLTRIYLDFQFLVFTKAKFSCLFFTTRKSWLFGSTYEHKNLLFTTNCSIFKIYS